MGGTGNIRWLLGLAGAMLLLVFGPVGSAVGCEFTLKAGGESSGPGRLSAPNDVAIDASGNAWVADTAHNRVQKFNSSGEFVSQFGVSTGVNGIDLDSAGDVWVVGNTTVREYSPSGELKLSFGSQGTATASSAKPRTSRSTPPAASGLSTAGEFLSATTGSEVQLQRRIPEPVRQTRRRQRRILHPLRIAADSEGNILVADTGNNRYQEFNSAGEFVRKVGSEGTGNGQFKFPRGIAVDSEGRVWVTDSGNNRLQRFSSKGAYQTQFGAYGPNDGQFVSPRGIAISGTNLWVADTGQRPGAEVQLQRRIHQISSAASPPAPAASRPPATSRSTPQATPGSPTPPTTASRSSTPAENSSASSGYRPASTASTSTPQATSGWSAKRSSASTAPPAN